MRRGTRIRAGLFAPALALMLASGNAHAQAAGGAFGRLCAVYNQYFSANSQLIGFGLMIMVIVALVNWFGGWDGKEKRGLNLAFLFVFIPITAGVVLLFPQILGTMGVTTC